MATRFLTSTATTVAGLAAAAVIATVAVAPQAGAATTGTPLRQQVLSGAKASIMDLAQKSGADDQQFLAQGRFRYPGSAPCPRCDVGPAVGAAAVYARTGDSSMRKIALNVFDRAIKDQVRKDGSFSAGVASEGGNTIQTVFFAEHLGSAMFYLGSSLDPAHKALYTKTLRHAASYLIAKGMNTYYVNGNINLATTLVLGMAWKQTGSSSYRKAYDASLAFTLKPKGEFASFGLRVSRKGSTPASTAAFLVERGPGGAGFDPHYTTVQADLAAQGFQVLGDARLLTLVHQLNNQMLRQTDRSDWTYDVSGGTRHPEAKGHDLYTSPAMYLSAQNGRPDLKSAAASQLARSAVQMRASVPEAAAVNYQSWGSRWAVDVYGVR